MTSVFQRFALALIAGAILGGCAAEAVTDSSPETSVKSLHVTRAEMGKDWPLSVNSGEVSCEGTKDSGALFFTHNGKRYGINGVALTGNRALDIRESSFWANDPKIAGTKISIGPLMEKARSACN